MFQWFQTMSTFEQLTVLAAAISSLIGSAWWMSKMYFTLNDVKTNTKATGDKIDTLTEKMDGELHDVRAVQREMGRDVASLKERVGKVEGIIEAEFGAE